MTSNSWEKHTTLAPFSSTSYLIRWTIVLSRRLWFLPKLLCLELLTAFASISWFSVGSTERRWSTGEALPPLHRLQAPSTNEARGQLLRAARGAQDNEILDQLRVSWMSSEGKEPCKASDLIIPDLDIVDIFHSLKILCRRCFIGQKTYLQETSRVGNPGMVSIKWRSEIWSHCSSHNSRGDRFSKKCAQAMGHSHKRVRESHSLVTNICLTRKKAQPYLCTAKINSTAGTSALQLVEKYVPFFQSHEPIKLGSQTFTMESQSRWRQRIPAVRCRLLVLQ